MRKKEKIRLLELEITNLNTKIAKISNELDCEINYTRELQMCLKSVLNELTEANSTIDIQNNRIDRLEEQLLKEKELVKQKDTSRLKLQGKVMYLSRINRELETKVEISKNMIVNMNHDINDLRYQVKTNKDARTYLKGKSERE